MKKSFGIKMLAALLATATGWAAAASIPLNAVNKAADAIDRAVAAHGGAEVLEGIRTVSQRSRFINYATNQSRRPGPPWDQSANDNLFALDFEREIAFIKNQGEGGGFATDAATLISPEENLNLDYRAKTATPIAEPDFQVVAGPNVRVTPALLIRSLHQRRHTSHWLGEAAVDGKPADIVTLVMETGPALALYIDRASGLLTQAERVLAPFGQVLYRYGDYHTVDGIAVNRSFELFANGEPNLTIELGPLVINEPIDDHLVVPKSLKRRPAQPPDALGVQALGDGVFLIGGSGTYALFAEQGDHVVAIGGTAGIADRIALLRNAGVSKPIRYAVMSHHHNDHLLGVADYVAEGATIVGHEAHAAVIQDSAEGDFALQTVVDQRTLGEGGNRVELYDLGPTPHVEHLLVAFLPEHGLLFQADHSGAPRVGRLGPAQPVAVALQEAVERKGLKVKHYISAHSPRLLSAKEWQRSVALARAR